MTQLPSSHGRRVLIIEDEFLIALDLEATMFKLGFDVCALAPSARKARSLAMNDQPDVALVDVCLEGGREGIEIARWLREVCEVPIVFVTAQTDEDTVQRIHEQVPGAPVLSKPVFRHTLAGAVAAVTSRLLHCRQLTSAYFSRQFWRFWRQSYTSRHSPRSSSES